MNTTDELSDAADKLLGTGNYWRVYKIFLSHGELTINELDEIAKQQRLRGHTAAHTYCGMLINAGWLKDIAHRPCKVSGAKCKVRTITGQIGEPLSHYRVRKRREEAKAAEAAAKTTRKHKPESLTDWLATCPPPTMIRIHADELASVVKRFRELGCRVAPSIEATIDWLKGCPVK